MLAVDPSSRRSGGSLLGDRARIEFDPADRGVLIRSTAAGERLGGLACGHARRRAGAGGGVRRRRDRDGRRRPGRDRGRRRRRHRRRGRAAGQRRRAAVPEVGDHGDPRRARRHQGRPRPDRDAHAARPERGAALARLARDAACSRSPRCRRRSGIEELVGGARRAPRRPRPRRAAPARAPARGALADFAREHGERGLRALGGRARAPSGCSAEQDPGARRAGARRACSSRRERAGELRDAMARDLLIDVRRVRARQRARRRARRGEPRHGARLRSDRASRSSVVYVMVRR